MRVVDFKRLRMRLLKGGIAPKFVKRTIMEMSAHLEDLIKQEKQNGVSEAEARALAFSALGDEDALVRETLAKKELISWSRRFPKTMFLIVLIVLYFTIALCALTLGIEGVRILFGIDIHNNWPAWHFQYSKALMFFMEYMLAPMLAFSIAYIAVQRNVNMRWPLIGAFVICFFGLGFETVVAIPDERGRGGVNLIWGWPFLPWENARPPWDQSIEQFVRVIVTMFTMYYFIKRFQPYEVESN